MSPPKRRSKGGQPIHDADVTPSRVGHDRSQGSPQSRQRPAATSRTAPPSPRYTPPVRAVRYRPAWHRLVGATLLVIGVLVAVLNDVMRLQPDLTLLPGGHNELYLFAGVACAGYSTWWFGWFDRKK